MRIIEDLFVIHHAKSAPLDRYKPGAVPYLGNSFSNVVSAFGEATIQLPPFIAYGAAGTSLTVLQPRETMTVSQLAYIAAWMNAAIRWRFNWYHRSIPDRLKRIAVPDEIPSGLSFQVKALLPPITNHPRQRQLLSFRPFVIERLFHMHRAKSGLFSDYEPGPVAYIRNGMGDNGIVDYVEPLPTDKVFGFKAVVVSAFCEATVQSPPFVACSRAGNGLIVLEPKTGMSTEQLFCVAAYINRAVRWRFNWYRQVTTHRIRKLSVLVLSHTCFDIGKKVYLTSKILLEVGIEKAICCGTGVGGKGISSRVGVGWNTKGTQAGSRQDSLESR